jgi:hypothetical protein
LTGGPSVRTLRTVREQAQAMYDRVISWYEDAERKAQVILTLDGVFAQLARWFGHVGGEALR